MMKDKGGHEIKIGEVAALLCQVVAIEQEGVVVKICNSSMQLLVTAKPDDLGNDRVASAELMAISEEAA